MSTNMASAASMIGRMGTRSYTFFTKASGSPGCLIGRAGSVIPCAGDHPTRLVEALGAIGNYALRDM
ncbi:MAG: hypothetical protein PVG32_08320 [Anaerolineales bacterium]